MNNLEINQEILITIKRVGINGEGIGYYKKLAIFVPNTLPSEEVVVRITKSFNNYAMGEAVRIKGNPSTERVEPKCKHFGVCGGCQFQHVDYQAQLKFKKNIVMESFNRYYDRELNPMVFHETVGMEAQYNYRNKVKRPVRYDGDNLVTGLYAFDTNRLVYIDECIVEKQDLNECLKEVCKFLTLHEVIAYNPKSREGVLRHIVARSSKKTSEIQVTLILYKEDKRTIKIAKELVKIPNIVSVSYTVNDDLDALENFGAETILVSGVEKISERVLDQDYNLLPTSFFQLNLDQSEKMYKIVEQYAKLKMTDKVLDCYCGVGTIALSVARSGASIIGIDSNKEAIINANDNANLNGIMNTKFICGDVFEELSILKENGFIPDVFIADPPRTGLDLKILNYLQNNKVKRIVYVSCNHSTLAKNCNHLASKYRILHVQPLDMFPLTSNVETIVLLERK